VPFKSILTILLTGVALAGCQTLEENNPAQFPSDPGERFPIELRKGVVELPVYPALNNRLDPEVVREIVDFVRAYRQSGRTDITVSVPSEPDGRVSPVVGAQTKMILEVLARGGIDRRFVRGSSYLPSRPNAINPIRLTYGGLRAGVANQCGLWPDDLGFASIDANIDNLPYWNQGCAVNSNIAAQLADPLDVVRPNRAEGPDVARGTAKIAKNRNGEDPSTRWQGKAEGVAGGINSGGGGR
jgi:pilus assembly protein CpaD